MRYPYSLHKRSTIRRPGHVYYAQFRDSDGDYLPGRSTGQTTLAAARTWAEEVLHSGQITTRDTVRFDRFSKDFFNDKSDYVRFHRGRGKQLGAAHLRNQQAYVDNYLAGFFGSTRLRDITTDKVEELREHLIDESLSVGTINHIFIALRLILAWALRERFIPAMPLIERVNGKAEERGILTPDEADSLFKLTDWPTMHRALNLLAYMTGMRQGELLALKWGAIDFAKKTILVANSWERKEGLKPTKTGKPRTVFLAPMAETALLKWKELQTPADSNRLIFEGAKAGKPIDHKIVEKNLHAALARIGIAEEVRQQRNITFHSSRHYFNTRMVELGVPLLVVQSLTGHSSLRMTQRYFHPQDETLVRAALTQIGPVAQGVANEN